MMRTFTWLMALLLLLPSLSLAEDKPNPAALKKAYDDALVQLKAAQDSKNALAKKNADLTKQVEELKKQRAADGAELQDLRRQAAENDAKTFELRSSQAAWKSFMRLHPGLLAQWKLFIADDALAVPQEPIRLIDPEWLSMGTQASAQQE